MLDADIENWPICDFLISFFSDGFPIDKASQLQLVLPPRRNSLTSFTSRFRGSSEARLRQRPSASEGLLGPPCRPSDARQDRRPDLEAP